MRKLKMDACEFCGTEEHDLNEYGMCNSCYDEHDQCCWCSQWFPHNELDPNTCCENCEEQYYNDD